jgi:hypothetical protein
MSAAMLFCSDSNIRKDKAAQAIVKDIGISVASSNFRLPSVSMVLMAGKAQMKFTAPYAWVSF